MIESELVLFQRFPSLSGAVPRARLTELPTPAHRLNDLESTLAFDGELWVKRDDVCGRWYGGNKPRKLEFLLGEALAKGAGTVITFGGLGTHHGLATTICAGELGLKTVLILVDEPVREESLANLLLNHAHGAELCYAGHRWRAMALGVWQWLRHCDLLRWQFPYIIMPGGSSARGAIGYVNAMLELESQIQAGVLPEPDYVFVAVGSNGTMAGLEAGLRLTALSTKVIGVRVSDQIQIDAEAVADLANDTLLLLGRHAPQVAEAEHVPVGDVTIWHDYLGRGYAYPTPEAQRAVDIMAECASIELEFVYTGKAMAALIEAAGRPEFQGRRILFWNTYNSMPLPGPSPEEVDYGCLPAPFHQFFEPPHSADSEPMFG